MLVYDATQNGLYHKFLTPLALASQAAHPTPEAESDDAAA